MWNLISDKINYFFYYLKMVKKINRDAESIIKLLSLGYKHKQIVQILNLKNQKEK